MRKLPSLLLSWTVRSRYLPLVSFAVVFGGNVTGADAIATAEQAIADLKAQIDAHRELSTSLAFD